MKSVFEANYSRKLSSLKNRLVVVPTSDDDSDVDEPTSMGGFFYWQWAFESPHEVKVLVRKILGAENTPSGHLRLVLLPIVYNALSQKAELRRTSLFKTLHMAVKRSKYYSLLKHPSPEEDAEIEAELGPMEQLFAGPHNLKLTQEKYMKTYQEAAGTEPPVQLTSKRVKADGGTSPSVASIAKGGGGVSPTPPGMYSLEHLWETQREFQREVRESLAMIGRDLAHLSQAVTVLTHHVVMGAEQTQQAPPPPRPSTWHPAEVPQVGHGGGLYLGIFDRGESSLPITSSEAAHAMDSSPGLALSLGYRQADLLTSCPESSTVQHLQRSLLPPATAQQQEVGLGLSRPFSYAGNPHIPYPSCPCPLPRCLTVHSF